MIKEAIGTGATVEEAKENAILELDAGIDDDIQFEVLATPKRKTLGLFGGSAAKVRVFVEVPDPIIKKEKPAKPQAKKARPAKAEAAPKKAAESNVAAKEEKEVSQADASQELVLPDPIPAADVAKDSPSGRAVAYLSTILEGLGCANVNMTVQALDRMAFINLEGENLGVVIGRRGETLDALQYLTSLAANDGGGYFRITLNIGDYREKRKSTLKSLAKRMSNQVLKTGRSRSLEPMNPYERRIIHTTVQAIDGVVSSSIGEGAARHVVIRPENGGKPERDRRNSRPRRDSAKAAPVAINDQNREPKKDHDNIPLYGKIN